MKLYLTLNLQFSNFMIMEKVGENLMTEKYGRNNWKKTCLLYSCLRYKYFNNVTDKRIKNWENYLKIKQW